MSAGPRAPHRCWVTGYWRTLLSSASNSETLKLFRSSGESTTPGRACGSACVRCPAPPGAGRGPGLTGIGRARGTLLPYRGRARPRARARCRCHRPGRANTHGWEHIRPGVRPRGDGKRDTCRHMFPPVRLGSGRAAASLMNDDRTTGQPTARLPAPSDGPSGAVDAECSMIALTGLPDRLAQLRLAQVRAAALAASSSR